MKSIRNLLLSTLAVILLTAATGNPSDDSRWLQAVQHMIAQDRIVSTPSLHRVELLQTWARENGYTVTVSHTSPLGIASSSYFLTVTR